MNLREGRDCAPGEGRSGAPAARLPARGNGNGRADPAPAGGLPETTCDHPRSAASPSRRAHFIKDLTLYLCLTPPAPALPTHGSYRNPPPSPKFITWSPPPLYPLSQFADPRSLSPANPSPSSPTHPFSPSPPPAPDPALLLLYPAMPQVRPPHFSTRLPLPWLQLGYSSRQARNRRKYQLPPPPGVPLYTGLGGGPSAPAPRFYWPQRLSIISLSPRID